MTAGRRDNLVTLQRYTTTQDESGQEVETWAPLGTAWAAVYYGTGQERREAAREQGSQTATFEVLANATTRSVTVRDRIVFDGTWDITAANPIGRKEIALTAVRAQ